MRPVLSFNDFFNSIWLKIPSVFREQDANSGKPLEILTLTLAQHLYYTFYLKLASMDELFDADLCPPQYLPFLASIINWKLIGTDVASWRHQIQAAPLLWKIKGTKKSITLAEKLIGYSVFMTELWRDYVGNIVPKEQLWNNFPETTLIKPWFRNSAPDIKNSIYNNSFSDLLPSFNQGTIVSETNYTSELATTPQYNPITGSGSNARLAKASRINVVLKKDLDLDFNTNGIFTDSNLSEAVDLLLQFKPFHVYINNFIVMYDLTDYLLGYTEDASGGNGSLPGDAIISRESANINVAIENATDDPNNNDERITYYQLESIDTINDVELSSDDPSYLKGILSIESNNFTLANLDIEVNPVYLTSLGFSLAGYALNIQLDNGKSLWTQSDFELGIPAYSLSSIPSLIDTQTNTIFYTSINPSPAYSFYTYPIKFKNACSLNQIINGIVAQNSNGKLAGISSIATKSGLYNDSLTIETTSLTAPTIVLSQNTNNSPVSLQGFIPLYDKIASVGTVMNDSSLYTGNFSNDITSWTNALLTSDILLFIEYDNQWYKLAKNYQYNYDTTKQQLVINLYEIANLVSNGVIPTSSALISGSSFYLVYPRLEANQPTYNNETISRNTNISYRKNNRKFNRTTFLDNSAVETYIQTTNYNQQYIFDADSGTLLEDKQNTRNYKKDLPKLFTRSFLLFEDSTGTANLPITVDKYSPRDTALWQVFITPTENYVGPEPISFGLWSNFYNVPVENTFYFTPYNFIDTSAEAQITCRQSARWQSVIASLPTSYPAYFFSSRENIPSRTSLWTRGSASTLPIPYKGNNRSSIQGYRGDTALFSRTAYMSDYGINIAANYQVDNYKYEDTLGVDQTSVYKNGSSLDTLEVTPQTEILQDVFVNSTSNFKTQINPQLWNSSTDYLSGQAVSYYNIVWLAVSPVVGNAPSAPNWKIIGSSEIVYPALSNTSLNYIPQYDEPFDFSNKQTYYLQDTTNCKPSFYANNIRMDINPYTGGLVTESFDTLDMAITGLITNQDSYLITIDNIDTSSFILQKQNVFVTWSQINSGSVISIGQPASFTFPTISVIKNGVELAYGDYWLYSTEPNIIYLQPITVLSVGDTIEIIYNTLDSTTLAKYPSYVDPNNSENLIVCSTNNSQQSSDSHSITLVNKMFLEEYTFNNNPIISWYRIDNFSYISSSVDLTKITSGITKTALTPVASMFRDMAVPDVIVYKNGIALTYGQDWRFTSVPSVTSWSYRVVLKQNITQSLQPYDNITITYTSLLAS